MSRKLLIYAENAAVIIVVALVVHYLAGLDWPWAFVIGAGASIVLRWLVDHHMVPGFGARSARGSR